MRSRTGGTHRRTGTEPSTARSALGLRAVLSSLALVAGLVAAIWFAVIARQGGVGSQGFAVAAVICAAVVVAAGIDLAVIRHRRRHGF
jgi:hypothetical protein